MLFYSKPAQYALRAISYLVSHEGASPAQALNIAEAEDIPRHYLSKILHQLVSANILVSTKGPGGGFALKRDAETISLYEVVKVFDDLEGFNMMCATGWGKCNTDLPCALHKTYSKIHDHIFEFLTSVNLAVFTGVKEFKNND